VSVRISLTGGAGTYGARFGSHLDGGIVLATRSGTPGVLEVTDHAHAGLLTPFAGFLNTTAVAGNWAAVDSILLEPEGLPPVRAIAAPDSWRAVLPPGRGRISADRAGHLLGDLVFHLARLPITEVLPPCPEADPLRQEGRAGLTVWSGGADGSQWESVVLGYLAADGSAAVHYPASGKLLGVPPDILVSFRSVFTALGLQAR